MHIKKKYNMFDKMVFLLILKKRERFLVLTSILLAEALHWSHWENHGESLELQAHMTHQGTKSSSLTFTN